MRSRVRGMDDFPTPPVRMVRSWQIGVGINSEGTVKLVYNRHEYSPWKDVPYRLDDVPWADARHYTVKRLLNSAILLAQPHLPTGVITR